MKLKFSFWSVIASSLLLTGMIVMWACSDIFFKTIPNNFTYSANIISYDNFYNEEKHEFSGQILSATNFSYEVVNKNSDVFIIRNRFDVRKPSGKPIFSVERLYGIDSYTGRHIPGFGDKDRNGYLFAPKKLDKQDFIYWHINYDTPATMHFLNEEKIEELKVYKYQCKYQADQTANLDYLQKVPEERGIGLDIVLTLWLEPITGRLIKYEDNTIAWYYDILTKKRLFPWNKFKNEYDPVSISNQVNITNIELEQRQWRKYAIPALLFFLSLIILILGYHSGKQTGLLPYITVSLICILGVSSSILFSKFLEKSEKLKQEMLFSDDCEAFRSSLRKEIDDNIGVLHGLKAAFIIEHKFSRQQFKKIAHYYLEHTDGVMVLDWIPGIYHKNRAEFENNLT